MLKNNFFTQIVTTNNNKSTIFELKSWNLVSMCIWTCENRWYTCKSRTHDNFHYFPLKTVNKLWNFHFQGRELKFGIYRYFDMLKTMAYI
jgi:hypothetical protein